MALSAAIYFAFNKSIGASMSDSMSLPRQIKVLETIANFWWWWPGLAISWKRIRDLGHGWELFAPLVVAMLATVAFDIAGLRNATLYASAISFVFLAVLGTLKGTRFVAHNA